MNNRTKAFQMKTVCYYIDSLGPGGAERQVAVLAAALSRRGVQTHVVCRQLDGIHGHYLDLFQGTSVVTHVLDRQFLAAGAAFARKNPERMRVLRGCSIPRLDCLLFLGRLIDIAPGILHCYLDIANCVGGVAGLITDAPHILLSFRSVDPATAGQARAGRFKAIYELLLQHPNIALEANTAHAAACSARWLGISPESITVKPNGISPDACLPSEAGGDYPDITAYLTKGG